VDVDPAMIGRYYGDVTYGVVGDLVSFAEGLLPLVGGQAAEAKAPRADWIAELQTAKGAWVEQTAVADASPEGYLSPADIVRALREVAPDDTVLIPDAGNPGIWSFLWEIVEPRSYIKLDGFENRRLASRCMEAQRCRVTSS
jgi:acetolactate synthase I/II/III large subunit